MTMISRRRRRRRRQPAGKGKAPSEEGKQDRQGDEGDHYHQGWGEDSKEGSRRRLPRRRGGGRPPKRKKSR